MAIAVSCDCGQQYQLKDELAGKLVKCPACGESLRVAEITRNAQADPAADRRSRKRARRFKPNRAPDVPRRFAGRPFPFLRRRLIQ